MQNHKHARKYVPLEGKKKWRIIGRRKKREWYTSQQLTKLQICQSFHQHLIPNSLWQFWTPHKEIAIIKIQTHQKSTLHENYGQKQITATNKALIRGLILITWKEGCQRSQQKRTRESLRSCRGREKTQGNGCGPL